MDKELERIVRGSDDTFTSKEQIKKLCETASMSEVRGAVRRLVELYEDDELLPRLKGIFDVGDVTTRLFDATMVSPSERVHRQEMFERRRRSELILHTERVEALEYARRRRALYLAHARKIHAKLMRSKRIDHVGALEKLVISVRDLRRLTPNQWHGICLFSQPIDVRLALVHSIETFAHEYGRTHVPRAVVLTVEDAIVQFAAIDIKFRWKCDFFKFSLVSIIRKGLFSNARTSVTRRRNSGQNY